MGKKKATGNLAYVNEVFLNSCWIPFSLQTAHALIGIAYGQWKNPKLARMTIDEAYWELDPVLLNDVLFAASQYQCLFPSPECAETISEIYDRLRCDLHEYALSMQGEQTQPESTYRLLPAWADVALEDVAPTPAQHTPLATMSTQVAMLRILFEVMHSVPRIKDSRAIADLARTRQSQENDEKLHAAWDKVAKAHPRMLQTAIAKKVASENPGLFQKKSRDGKRTSGAYTWQSLLRKAQRNGWLRAIPQKATKKPADSTD